MGNVRVHDLVPGHVPDPDSAESADVGETRMWRGTGCARRTHRCVRLDLPSERLRASISSRQRAQAAVAYSINPSCRSPARSSIPPDNRRDHSVSVFVGPSHTLSSSAMGTGRRFPRPRRHRRHPRPAWKPRGTGHRFAAACWRSGPHCAHTTGNSAIQSQRCT